MARNTLPLSHYKAGMVWMPGSGGAGKEVKTLRVIVFGPNFPQRAVEPELLVGEKAAGQVSIGRDQKSIQGYFLDIPQEGAVIRVRYGDSLEGELQERFSRERIQPLDNDCGGMAKTTLTFDDFVSLLLAQLTDEERRGSVAYAAERRLPAGAQIQFTGIRIVAQADSFIGFIDRDPSANWGHPARYVVVNQETGEIRSLAARFPPFRSGDELRWRVVYRAPSLPDTAVERPR